MVKAIVGANWGDEGKGKITDVLDYPGKLACILFTYGCNYRCPFCHNSSLVLTPNATPVDVEEIFSFLNKRKGILDGVVLTGGEPLLWADAQDFLARVRELGAYSIKLDTNGTHPDRLRAIIDKGLCDYVAMDIKNSPARYPETVGIPNFDVSGVCASASLLLEGRVDYEFRTTAVYPLHSEEAFSEIADFIHGARRYFIQNFVDSGALIGDGMSGFDERQMQRFADIVRGSVDFVELRGI